MNLVVVVFFVVLYERLRTRRREDLPAKDEAEMEAAKAAAQRALYALTTVQRKGSKIEGFSRHQEIWIQSSQSIAILKFQHTRITITFFVTVRVGLRPVFPLLVFHFGSLCVQNWRKMRVAKSRSQR